VVNLYLNPLRNLRHQRLKYFVPLCLRGRTNQRPSAKSASQILLLSLFSFSMAKDAQPKDKDEKLTAETRFEESFFPFLKSHLQNGEAEALNSLCPPMNT